MPFDCACDSAEAKETGRGKLIGRLGITGALCGDFLARLKLKSSGEMRLRVVDFLGLANCAKFTVRPRLALLAWRIESSWGLNSEDLGAFGNSGRFPKFCDTWSTGLRGD